MYTPPDEQSAANTTDKSGLGDVFSRASMQFADLVPPQLLMRAQSLGARRFVSIPGAMWEGWFGEQWGEAIKLEMPIIKRGLQKIERDYRSNRMSVDFRAASNDASTVTAATIGGIYRADDYHFKSKQARDNAFSEALRGGFGAYRLTNQWADPYDKDSDEQRINPAETIVDADQTVFFDPNAKLYDKSDAKFCYVLTAYSVQAYHARFGEDKSSTWDNNLVKPYYDWYTPQVIRVAEYYEVEDIDELLYVFTQGLSGEEERWFKSQLQDGDIAEKKALGWTVRTRTVKRRRVHKYLMSGNEILEDCGYIAGSMIPIVPVYYSREYVDNQERFTGYVQDRMDMQRNYNARVSKLAETDALAPREMPIFDQSQMPQNIADMWAKQNIERHPYAIVGSLYHPVTGEFISAGPIGKIEPPTLPPVTAALLQIARADIEEDNTDPDEVKSNTSAEAMDLAATRIDARSELPIDNMRQSIQREGEIYLSQAADIYYEPGREVDTLSEDGEDDVATLVQEQVDPATGVYAIHNDFAQGKYKVIADVTESTSTRRDKTVKAALNGVQVAGAIQDQEAGQVCLSVAFMNMDGEGTDVLQKFGRRRLVGLGLVEPNDEEKAQMQAAQQNQQPDPAQALAAAQAQALGAQAEKDTTTAQLNMAKVGDTKASAILKIAQATAVGGPDKAPDVPSGLQAPAAVAKIADTAATAQLKRAQAGHLQQQIMDRQHAREGVPAVLDHAQRIIDLHHSVAKIEDLRKPKEAA